jgi:hypothetical protein
MTLFLHVVGAIVGIVGAYLFSFTYFFKPQKSTLMLWGKRLAYCGLILLFITGIILFLRDIPKWSHSSKFLSNMTVLAVLLINETVQKFNVRIRNKKRLMSLSVFISLYSWTWTLVVAPHDSLPYSYLSIILTYGVSLGVASATYFLISTSRTPSGLGES